MARGQGPEGHSLVHPQPPSRPRTQPGAPHAGVLSHEPQLPRPCPHQAPGQLVLATGPKLFLRTISKQDRGRGDPCAVCSPEVPSRGCRRLQVACGAPRPLDRSPGPSSSAREPCARMAPPQALPGPQKLRSPRNTQAFPAHLLRTSAACSEKQTACGRVAGRGRGPEKELSQGHPGQADHTQAPSSGVGAGHWAVQGPPPASSQAGMTCKGHLRKRINVHLDVNEGAQSHVGEDAGHGGREQAPMKTGSSASKAGGGPHLLPAGGQTAG